MSDDIKKCVCCGYTVAVKGDSRGWLAIQPDPSTAELNWYCMLKVPCEDAFDAASELAAEAWQAKYTPGVLADEPEPALEKTKAVTMVPANVVPIPESEDNAPGWLVATEE